MAAREYLARRRKLSGLFFETALPNEYLVIVGRKSIKPILGGKKFKWFKKFLRVPAYVQRLQFQTDNANIDYQGIGIEGYASWRIDQENPQVSISTLDFFDEHDPMERTNEDLKTICIEAVRHVISNMTIDDALKKKDEIANNLKAQLKTIEKKWGIVFDQVGIEKVRIMSNTLFKDLQADFRNQLRLSSEKTRITTDRQIAAEENTMQEKTVMEQMNSEQNIELVKITNKTALKEREITEKHKFIEQEREHEENHFRNEMTFKLEKEKKNHEFSMLEKKLMLSLNEAETKLLETEENLQNSRNTINEKKLEIHKLTRQIEQTYTEKELMKLFISSLPEVFKSLNISNYSVLDSSNNGNITPISKVINELMITLKNSGLKWFSDKKED